MLRAITNVTMLLLTATVAFAQESASYRLEEHVLNNGGHPAGGATMTSTSFRISLDSIGDGTTEPGAASASYRLQIGLESMLRPPGEVVGLSFTDPQTLVWSAEGSVGTYNLYREPIADLSALGYGQCEQQQLTAATATDTDPVAVGDGFFYLVTAVNRLNEEGTKGNLGNGTERIGNACP